MYFPRQRGTIGTKRVRGAGDLIRGDGRGTASPGSEAGFPRLRPAQERPRTSRWTPPGEARASLHAQPTAGAGGRPGDGSQKGGSQ